MTFTEFDAMLSSGMSEDYWHDQAVDLAADRLDAFQDSDWERLLAVLGERPLDWRVRVTEAMGTANVDRAFPVLCELLADEQLEVATAALEALECRDDVFHPSPALRPVIVSLRDRLPPHARPTADALLKRVVNAPG